EIPATTSPFSDSPPPSAATNASSGSPRRTRSKGYQGAGTVRVPYRVRWEKLSAGQKAVNVSHARIRAVGEQAMATLKSWRLLRKLRCSTTRITDLVKAVLALHLAV
ncbi:transposase family protein, partial [Streptomyces sp. NPDC094468]|uniref:transposase family protein n=1 Tax=Streptomyces sp. NPDC094468 TaxID=3366066 RepID=UPI0037FFA394